MQRVRSRSRVWQRRVDAFGIYPTVASGPGKPVQGGLNQALVSLWMGLTIKPSLVPT